MKKNRLILFVVVVVVGVLTINGYGLNAGVLIEEVDFSLSADIYSKYIWRGQNLGDDPVIQPGFSMAYSGFTASIWASYDTGDGDEWTECDYTLDYSASLSFIDEKLEKLGASVGYTYYTFPNLNKDDTSQEVYLGLGLDVLLSPCFTVYYDFDTGDGIYYEAGISHTFSAEYFDITPSATIGYNDGQWGYDSSFSAALVGLSASVPLKKYIVIEPGVYGSLALDDQYEDEFYGGVGLSFNF